MTSASRPVAKIRGQARRARPQEPRSIPAQDRSAHGHSSPVRTTTAEGSLFPGRVGGIKPGEVGRSACHCDPDLNHPTCLSRPASETPHISAGCRGSRVLAPQTGCYPNRRGVLAGTCGSVAPISAQLAAGSCPLQAVPAARAEGLCQGRTCCGRLRGGGVLRRPDSFAARPG